MKFHLFIIIVVLASFSLVVYAEQFSDYATEVVDFSGSFGPSPYDDPCSVLGKPTTMCQNSAFQNDGEPFRVKLVEPAYNVDTDGNRVITTIQYNSYITVKFDHKVVDYPGNLYGKDFIVFGNSFFIGNGSYVSDITDMRTYPLAEDLWNDPVVVSVSQDGITWYEFDSGPYADYLFPTQAYVWDANLYDQTGNGWTDQEMDFTKPIDPNLTADDFEYISSEAAIELYDGSGGGTAYDINDLADYHLLDIDPNSGYRWIQYVKLETLDPSYPGEVDAVSDVAACGDPTHPHPIGDIDKNCSVDMIDFALIAQNWLECTYGCD